MIVKFNQYADDSFINSPHFLEPGSYNEATNRLIDGEFYLVVAISAGFRQLWYDLDERSGLRYSVAYPACMFSIEEYSIPKSWIKCSFGNMNKQIQPLLAPEFWARDSFFHGRIFEGGEKELNLYADYLYELQLESSLPWIKDSAVPLGMGNWVTDSEYGESWEADPVQPMTRHPVSKELLHNPIWKD